MVSDTQRGHAVRKLLRTILAECGTGGSMLSSDVATSKVITSRLKRARRLQQDSEVNGVFDSQPDGDSLMHSAGRGGGGGGAGPRLSYHTSVLAWEKVVWKVLN